MKQAKQIVNRIFGNPRELGRGAFGIVWGSPDVPEYAVKIPLDPKVMKSNRVSKEWQAEAEMVQTLHRDIDSDDSFLTILPFYQFIYQPPEPSATPPVKQFFGIVQTRLYPIQRGAILAKIHFNDPFGKDVLHPSNYAHTLALNKPAALPAPDLPSPGTATTDVEEAELSHIFFPESKELVEKHSPFKYAALLEGLGIYYANMIFGMYWIPIDVELILAHTIHSYEGTIQPRIYFVDYGYFRPYKYHNPGTQKFNDNIEQAVVGLRAKANLPEPTDPAIEFFWKGFDQRTKELDSDNAKAILKAVHYLYMNATCIYVSTRGPNQGWHMVNEQQMQELASAGIEYQTGF